MKPCKRNLAQHQSLKIHQEPACQPSGLNNTNLAWEIRLVFLQETHMPETLSFEQCFQIWISSFRSCVHVSMLLLTRSPGTAAI